MYKKIKKMSKKNMPLPRIFASHSTIKPLLMRPSDPEIVKIRYFKGFGVLND
jgi:hypothetical protein